MALVAVPSRALGVGGGRAVTASRRVGLAILAALALAVALAVLLPVWITGRAPEPPATAEAPPGTLPPPSSRPRASANGGGVAPIIRATGRAYLLRDAREEPGFGLYSYLLFPAEDARHGERFLEATTAWLQSHAPIETLERALPDRATLNVFYYPVERAVASPEAPDPAALVGLYDYGRARAALALMAPVRGAGPVIASVLVPIGSAGGVAVLVQDLSWVPTPLVRLWIAEFQNEVRAGRSWSRATLDALALRLRTSVSVVAMGFDVAARAIEDWIDISAVAAPP